MLSSLKQILGDILYAYRHFFHWNISKILILIWSLILGILLMLPILLLAIIIGLIDPINWKQIIAFALGGPDATLEILASFTENIGWFLLLIILGLFSIAGFLLGSCSFFYLLARVYFGYINTTKISYKNIFKITKKELFTFIKIQLRTLMYFIPCIVLFFIIFGIAFQFSSSSVFFEIFLFAGFLVFLIAFLYLSYRIVFGYIILADRGDGEEIENAQNYIKKSLTLTQGKTFFKFIVVIIIYTLVVTPFNMYETHLEREMSGMGAALAYNTGQMGDISLEDLEYYKYIGAEYSDYSDLELSEQIQSIYIQRILYSLFMFLVFGGLLTLVLASSYKRILIKDKDII